MLTRRPRIQRGARAATALLELVVSLALFGIALGALGGLLARHERALASVDARLLAGAQLREGEGALAHDLLPLAPAAGDIAPGEARDSAVAIRVVVASGIACDTAGLSVALPPPDPDPARALQARLTMPQRGDTLWAWVDSVDTRAWMPLRVAAATTSRSRCPAAGFPVPIPAGPRLVVTLEGTASLPTELAPGTALRVTRRVRWSLYRASDRRWWLGMREQAATTGLLAAVQPVVGPLRPYAADPARSGASFRYFTATGTELPPGAADTREVALVRVTLRADTLPARAAPHAAPLRDSLVIVVAPRG